MIERLVRTDGRPARETNNARSRQKFRRRVFTRFRRDFHRTKKEQTEEPTARNNGHDREHRTRTKFQVEQIRSQEVSHGLVQLENAEEDTIDQPSDRGWRKMIHFFMIAGAHGHVNTLSRPEKSSAQSEQERREIQRPAMIMNVRTDEQSVGDTGENQRQTHTEGLRQNRREHQVAQTEDQIDHSYGKSSVPGVVRRGLEGLGDIVGHEDQEKREAEMNDISDIRSIHDLWERERKTRQPLLIVLFSQE